MGRELLNFYWMLGRDIESRHYVNTYGAHFYQTLSHDLRERMPGAKGFSPTNIKYMRRFFLLYAPEVENRPQPADDFLNNTIFTIPWDHHRRIIDHCDGDSRKALFYVRQTREHGWGRAMLLNCLSTDLYEREGKAITNFRATLPSTQSDLAQQMTRDPYNFDFLALRETYDERDLEDALVANVTRFLLELGKGFSFMGRQQRIEVGGQEFFPDLLFYNTKLHAYIVVELKTQSFKPEYLGQLSFYVTAVNHQLRTQADNPTIGILICKDKDRVVAQYALENCKEPIGISEYQLSRLYPDDYKTSLPSIEEIEKSLAGSVE